MTASLPLPEDDIGEREVAAPPPPVPPVSAADAAASAPAPRKPRAPRAPAKKPAAPRAPRAKSPKVAPVPPPPQLSAAEAAARWSAPVPEGLDKASDAVDADDFEAAEALLLDAADADAVDALDEVDVVEAAEAVEVPAEIEAVDAPAEIEAGEDAAPEEPIAAAPEEHVGAAAMPELRLEVDTAQTAVRLVGVTKSFGEERAVDALDLTIPPGAFYGIVGPNGAGKTTTLSMITGLLTADAGTIEVAGIDLAADPAAAKRRMGILPDRLRTFDRLTGRQLLHYYGVLRGLPAGLVESRTADLARAFDLTDALGRTVADYSTGMTKKLMLAGAMIHSPRVLVLDEPFESVDPVSSAVILDILSAYVEHGGTVILSSHGMDLVERVCSGVAILVDGTVARL